MSRLRTIQDGIFKGLNREQIAQECKVTEKTIDRDMNVWVNSGLFEVWLKKEWVQLHQIIIHENPTEAYRNLTKLVSHMLTRKVEMKEEISVREKVDVTILAEYVSALDSAINKDIQSLRAQQQVDSTQAHPETS